MSPGMRHASFTNAELIRLLAELTATEAAAPRPAFAERLAQWLGWTDAIALSAALNSGGRAHAAAPTGASAGRAAHAAKTATNTAADAAAQALARVRAALTQAIAEDGPLGARAAGRPRPAVPGLPADDPTDFAAYRRQHLALQRAMEMRIAPLRAQLRGLLAAQSAAGGRLAALDAALDDALAARERSLLASVPALLQQRFERLRQAPPDAPPAPAAGQPPGAAAPAAPGSRTRATPPPAWLALFHRELQAVLLAELELRLQPVAGLLDALRAEAACAPA